MALTSVLLFLLFLLLSAFFSAAETALISCNPYTLDFLEEKGSRRARAIKRLLARVDQMLAAILIGNNLVNIAAASVATLFFLSIIHDRHNAALLATLVTTLLVLFFGDINPKTFAAYHPVKVSMFVIQPIRFFVFLFYPFVKAFNFVSGLLFRGSPAEGRGRASSLNEGEIKLLLAKGIKGMSSLRKRMIGGVLDIGARPVKEIMIPRPEMKGIEISSTYEQILDTVLSTGYSRLPVYRGRLDNIEGLVHAKDILPYLIDKKEIDLTKLLRQPSFVPESASIEKVLIQMQANAVHLAFVVDEYGTLEGIITLEDIIEEIVGEIRDEYDEKAEDWLHQEGKNIYLAKGNASIKELNQRLPISLPQSGDFTTLAGFLFFKFGRIPHEHEALEHNGNQFIVEKMNKRHISLVRIILRPEQPGKAHEDRRHK
jgi:putative hemolysin